MPGKERRRQLERERHQRQVANRIRREERSRTVRAVLTSVLVVVVVVGGMGTLAYAVTSKKEQTKLLPFPTKSKLSCSYKKAPNEKDLVKKGLLKNVGVPPKYPTDDNRDATVQTNRGNIHVRLFGEDAPCTVNSFVYLTHKGLFDSTACHRVVNKQIYVLQCGKPKGKAQGPTYQYTTENTKKAKYVKGTLAMANSGTPDSNGSQFFIVFKKSPLPAQYTVFGEVTAGIGMVEKVGKAGATKEDPQVGGGPPKKKVTIEKISVSEQ